MSQPTTAVVAAREGLAAQLSRTLLDGGVDVRGVTDRAADVVALLDTYRPQILVLDGQLTGVDVARQVMARHPLPILAVVADADGQRAELTALGVVDIVRGPADDLARRVKLVSGVTVVRRRLPAARLDVKRAGVRLVAIGASTGGPAAVSTLLAGLGGLAVPVAVVQHMHADFVDGFVEWLQTSSPLEVRIAEDGEVMLPATVYVAGPRRHLGVDADLTVRLSDPVGGLHCPSVDALFSSVARHVGPNAVGVLLTGMGADGATGLRAMVDAGAATIVQDEESSAVYGMPNAALRLGAAQRVLALPDIAKAVRVAATAS